MYRIDKDNKPAVPPRLSYVYPHPFENQHENIISF